MTSEEAVEALFAELRRRVELHGKYNSMHEAVAVIEEEFLELRSAVYWSLPARRTDDTVKEALQLAATALRFVLEFGTDLPEKKSHDG